MLPTIIAWLFTFLQPSPCDPLDGDGMEWSAEQRQETRDRVRLACLHHLKASPTVCAFYEAVVIRESSGRASVRHTLGQGENGLGAMGLSLRWHANKWPGNDEDPMFCTPEVSLIVAHAIVWRAFTRYHATTMLDAQAVYGAQWRCFENKGKRTCTAAPNGRTEDAICGRMRHLGASCYAPITRKDLGRRVPLGERRQWVAEVLAARER